MRKFFVGALAPFAFLLNACAEYPVNIDAAYIPSLVYKGASCQELGAEQVRLQRYVQRTVNEQQRSSRNDTAAVTVSLFIFWPAIGAMAFSRDKAAHLAVARGHYNALAEASTRAHCPNAAGFANAGGYGYWKTSGGGFPPL
ncbi:MAG: hypothetical protein ACPGVK_11700 [Halocynthiibacter sp.]